MKLKITMSLEVEIIQWVEEQVKSGRFRNRSHGFEHCARLTRDRQIM